MKVSARKFVRQFSRFRERAERGEPVLVESRGAQFLFHRIGNTSRPRKVEIPLPKSVTERWDLDRSAMEIQEWRMNE